MSKWRNRIVGHGEEKADQLLANPDNWRIHPKNQQDALSDVLKEVGWVQNVIVNKATGFVVDGHMRVALAISQNETVPVTYVDLTPEEESLILATFDPISAAAVTDAAKLRELLSSVSTNSPALDELLSGVIKMPEFKEAAAPEGFASYDEDIETEYCCPKCGYQWSGKPNGSG